MSYILDALKKIEHEKNKKKNQNGMLNLSGDLFRVRSQPRAKSGTWKILTVIIAASLLTGGATWFVLRGSGTKSAAGKRPTALQSSQAPSAAAPVPAAVIPTPPIPALHAPPPPPAAVVPSVVPVAAAPATVKPAPQKKAEAGAEDDSRRQGAQHSKKESKVQAPPVQKSPTVPAPADIKLSGVAWQEERAARRAVINGFLLKEGAVISGAKITDIRADKVLFSTAAGIFELKLDSLSPGESPR